MMADDNDSSVMNYVEIIPLDNHLQSTDDVKFNPRHVKVCV